MKKVSLKDIAREAGVSVTLVSFVLSGKEKEQRVGKEAAARVRRIAREMNYQPNTLARSLRNGRTHTIGLIVADISNPFFAQLARAIEDKANKLGYSVIFANSNEDEQQFSNIIATLRSKSVDGFIIVPIENSLGTVRQMMEENENLVLLDRYLPELDTSYVVVDNYEAAKKATNLLIERGCTAPLMVTYKSGLIHMRQRKQGFLDAVSAAGLSRNVEVREILFSGIGEDIDRTLCKETLAKHDGIFFATNTLSYNGLKKIFDDHVPDRSEIPIVSFDHNDAFDFMTPFIPYVRQPIETMGSEAVSILIGTIEGQTDRTVRKILPGELVTPPRKEISLL
ncbi:MAG: LacI family DNA-binding transcriptional regulator [Bacteroidales bacterium]|nr:LacI family DNA-binding transcriptional regulator [Bacteroidales bacterium]